MRAVVRAVTRLRGRSAVDVHAPRGNVALLRRQPLRSVGNTASASLERASRAPADAHAHSVAGVAKQSEKKQKDLRM